MEAAQQEGSIKTGGFLEELKPEVFENANTITKWLLNQPQETQPQLAQEIFDKLLKEASQSRQYHGNGHACVRLCSFVQQCAKSSDDALKQWAFTETLSTKLFHFYLEWYEHDPHRALRLVLDVLVASSASNPSPETGKAIKGHVVKTLVSIVARKSTKQLTKSGLQCLDHLLNKKVINLGDIAAEYEKVDTSVAALSNLERWKSFVFHLFSWMELTYACPLAGKCIVHVFRGLNAPKMDAVTVDNVAEGFTLDIWRQWLQDALTRNPEILEDIKNYVLAPMFKTEREAALSLLDMFNRSQPLTAIGGGSTDHGLLLQLAALELGKKNGMVEEPSTSRNDDQPSQPATTKVVLQGTLLDSLLAHPSVSVRSSAFSLLVSSQATTKPFSEVAFDLLKKHLAAFHADYDARVRNEVLGHTKNLIKRAKNIMTVAQRSLSAQKVNDGKAQPAPQKKFGPEVALRDPSEAKEVLDRHQAFLDWYMGFLRNELLPTTSYQRHVTAIKAALLLLRVGKHAGDTDDTVDEDIAESVLSDSTWIRLLLDLLLDPFDDVRDGAATILGLLPPDSLKPNTSNTQDLLGVLRKFCARASALADRTGRADHGDGAARSQGLLCSWLNKPDLQLTLLSDILERVESKISKAEDDLGHAAIENPVHADFAAISYVWHVLSKRTFTDDKLDLVHHLQRRILFCAQQIWFVVKHVLCDDSPEGHLPEELEEIEGLDTKDLLSYSFRAVHESSNLLRLLVSTLRLKNTAGVPYPPLDVFRETGYLTFEQLSSLRHRGAFSTVSYTFTTCCQLTQALKTVYPNIDESENLLREWYRGAIECILTQASTTRRSAGIPSLIAAVLSANAASPSFEEVYGALEKIGKKTVLMSETDGSNLPQVHALNSLRDIFRSSLLSKKAEGYLARTLLLAATSLRSEVWAIRNCGLLLLRSLIDCLLGTGESKASIESGWDGHSVRISYNKYPTLPGVILDLLRSADATLDHASSSQTGAAEAVFPALDIIRRAGPPDEHRLELQKHIEGYLGSRLWHVREIAARTLCSFLLRGDWAREISRLLGESKGGMNRIHGTLLTARFVLERKADLGVELASDSESVDLLLEQLVRNQGLFAHCAEVQAASFEILNFLVSHGCQEQVAKSGLSTAATGQTNSSSALLSLHTSLNMVHETAHSKDITKLRWQFLHTPNSDINTANRVLEAIPEVWKQVGGTDVNTGLCNLYLEACTTSSAPEVRTQSLINLGSLMDELLRQGKVAELPSAKELDSLWAVLQTGDINPGLSCAIIETSGTIMAVQVARDSSDGLDMANRLRNWGEMLTDCLDVDNSFDTRYAAASALQSFFTHTKASPTNSISSPVWSKHSYLPVLSALYTSLIDDDDEVRETAASAASHLLGTPVVAPVAADRLVAWLGQQLHFGTSVTSGGGKGEGRRGESETGETETLEPNKAGTETKTGTKESETPPEGGVDTNDDEFEFNARVVYRMVGQPYPRDGVFLPDRASPLGLLSLVPAKEQLRKALDFDDSLFAAEEQNLFIDEVRETTRWREALVGSYGGARMLGRRRTDIADTTGTITASGISDGSPLSCLGAWVEDGLRCLIGLVGGSGKQEEHEEGKGEGEAEDGPLGWTSDQHVFAVCARVLLCAVAIVRIGTTGGRTGRTGSSRTGTKGMAVETTGTTTGTTGTTGTGSTAGTTDEAAGTFGSGETVGVDDDGAVQIGDLLRQFREAGKRGKIHGSLLEMAKV